MHVAQSYWMSVEIENGNWMDWNFQKCIETRLTLQPTNKLKWLNPNILFYLVWPIENSQNMRKLRWANLIYREIVNSLLLHHKFVNISGIMMIFFTWPSHIYIRRKRITIMNWWHYCKILYAMQPKNDDKSYSRRCL